jgi:hypothetical protein
MIPQNKVLKKNIKIPIVTCDDFMMPFAVFGLTKVAKEQGDGLQKQRWKF